MNRPLLIRRLAVGTIALALPALIAAVLYSTFVSKSRTISGLLELAAQNDRTGRYDRAWHYCDMVLKLDPKNIAATCEEKLINLQKPRFFSGDIITPHERNLSNATWTTTDYRFESTR